jgi:hypothetical protein
VFEAAIGHQAWRLRDIAEPTLEELRKIHPEDLAPTQDQVPVDWPGAPAADPAMSPEPEQAEPGESA